MFEIYLNVYGELREFAYLDRDPKYDEQYDDVNSIINDLCEVMSETNLVTFVVNGFGQRSWPVDVSIDLATILERVPFVLNSIINENYTFDLDFYEQGIQRRLLFSLGDTDDIVKVDCISGTDWIPSPKVIFLEKSFIKEGLFNLYYSFCNYSRNMFPKLSSHKWFIDWCNTYKASERRMG
jgi:hypothetical protein